MSAPADFGNKSKAEAALPPVTAPSATSTSPQAPQSLAQWWTAFNDPALTDLVNRALAGNPSLQVAQARIDEARGIRRTAFGTLWPSLDATANISRSQVDTRLGSRIDARQAGIDANWEVDLFGGNRRTLEAADAELLAAVADMNAASLSLAAETATQYIEYRGLQQQITLATASMKTQEEVLQLTKDLYSMDLTSGLEVSQAESVARSTAATLPVFERRLEATRQSLAVLAGTTAAELPAALTQQAPVPMSNAFPFLDAPTTVLSRRPDIVAAERRLASATALTGAEMVALYPSLNLGGFFGIGGGTDTSDAGIWSIAAGVAAPLLNFGTIQGRIDAQEARQMQAYQQYRQTILEAVADIETSLSDFAYETKHRDILAQAVASNRETLRLARLRFENSLTPFTDVLSAQQSVFVTEQQLATSETARAQALVAVYKSLGVAPLLP